MKKLDSQSTQKKRENELNRINEVESHWDVQLSFEWLYRIFGGYSVKHLRKGSNEYK
jgi:hypothetical protein